MGSKSTNIDFSHGILEFRINGEEVEIHGTKEGLQWLARKCLVRVDKNKNRHLHLEDYEVLTPKLKITTLVLWPENSKMK